jgi:hypothetical protein
MNIACQNMFSMSRVASGIDAICDVVLSPACQLRLFQEIGLQGRGPGLATHATLIYLRRIVAAFTLAHA